MSQTITIGDDKHRYKAGDVGFLIEQEHKTRGFKRYELRDHPAQEANTLAPKLYGEVDGGHMIVRALGVYRVESATPNGRGRARELTGKELRLALNELGYEDLMRQAPQ